VLHRSPEPAAYGGHPGAVRRKLLGRSFTTLGRTPSGLAASDLGGCLYGWAGQRAIRTKHAAISWLGTQESAASGTFVEKLTRIRGHGFDPADVAVRASDRGFGHHMDKGIEIHGESVLFPA
jgi:hypothetical protein